MMTGEMAHSTPAVALRAFRVWQVVVVFVAGVGASAGAFFALFELGVRENLSIALASAVQPTVMAVLLVWIARRWGGGVRESLGVRFSWRAIGLGTAFGSAAIFAATIVAIAVTIISGEEISATAADVTLLFEGDTAAIGVMIFAIAVLAPISEELVFRGALWSALERLRWPALAISIVSAGLFALIHFEPERIAVLLVAGLFMSEARRVTGSVVGSMVAHGIVNGVSALGLLATLSGNLPS